MFKLLVGVILITIDLFIQSDSVKSDEINSPKTGCKIFSYEPFKIRSNILSNISNNSYIGELSLTGTHESMSYRSPDQKIRTQELSVTQQLMYGVRFLDLTLRYSSFDTFEIYSRAVNLNCSLQSLLDTVDAFLKNNPQEFVIINLKYDGIVNLADDEDDGLLDDHFNELYGKFCQLFDNLHRRVIKNWKLEDVIKNFRGKILLSTTDSVFSKCMFSIGNECLLSNKIMLIPSGDGFNHYPIVNYKWQKYLYISKNIKFDKYQCYMYDFSVYDNYILFSLGFTKIGGYHNYSQKCIEPINYRIIHNYTDNRNASLTILMLDYVVPEIITKVNSYNLNKIK